MKFILFFILFFGLPHAAWFPSKFDILPEDIALGVTNILLLVALLLWVIVRLSSPSAKNPFSSYRYFLYIVILGVGIAFLSGFEENTWEMLTLSKREITLLLLYFIPLSAIKNHDDFVKFFVICLLVHLAIGTEVIRSGVLAGVHFADHKRGSGPFGLGWQGADVAGSYLAHGLMFFLAFLFTGRVRNWLKIVAGAGAIVLILGIFATYARGAMLGVGLGVLCMVVIRGLKFRYLLLPVMLLLILLVAMPQSVKTRFEETKSETGELDQSSLGRIPLIVAGIDIVKDHPLGVGTGQLRSTMQHYLDKYVDCHNGFLYTAVEYGVIGFCVFLWMLWDFLAASRRVYKMQSAPVSFRVYALGLGGMIGAFIGCNMFYANFYKDLMIGTIVIHFGMLAYIQSVTSGHAIDVSP